MFSRRSKIKKLNRTIAPGLLILFSVPIITGSMKEVEASAAPNIRRPSVGSVNSMGRRFSTNSWSSNSVNGLRTINPNGRGPSNINGLPSSSLRPINPDDIKASPMSKLEKTMGGIAIGVGGISVIGTIVALALTEEQFKQSETMYDKVINDNYNMFYDQREQELQALFNQFDVPMPDKYKNPLGGSEKPSGPIVDTSFTMNPGGGK